MSLPTKNPFPISPSVKNIVRIKKRLDTPTPQQKQKRNRNVAVPANFESFYHLSDVKHIYHQDKTSQVSVVNMRNVKTVKNTSSRQLQEIDIVLKLFHVSSQLSAPRPQDILKKFQVLLGTYIHQ